MATTVVSVAKVSKWQTLETEAKKLIAKPFAFLKDVEDVGEKTILVIEEVRVLTPQFKAELSLLIDDILPVANALQPVLASDGSNIGADIAVLKAAIPDVKKLVADFLKFVPTIETALKTLESDVESKPVPASAPNTITFDAAQAVPTADYVAPAPETETVERTD